MEKKDDLTFDFMTNREILQIAEPKDDLEKLILEKAMKELGEVTTVDKLVNYLGLSTSFVRRAINSRKLVTYKVGRKVFILTRSILNIKEVME